MEATAGNRVDPPLPVLPSRLERPRAKSKFSWELMLVAILLGASAIAFGPPWTRIIFQRVRLETFSALSAFLAALGIAIILHEAGHLIAALLVDFEILGGALGPIRATHLHGRWTFQLSGKRLSASISAIPRQNHSWRKRMLLVVAAGPGATLLTGAIAAFVSFSGDYGAWSNAFLASVSELSFFLFVLGLIPNAAKAQARNDARLCYDLFHNTPEAQEILLYHLVAQIGVAGMRPRDYPERLIRKLAAARSRPDMALIFAHTIVIWAIDRGDIQTAGAWEQRAVELSDLCDLRLQNLTLARSAFFDVLFRDNLASAQSKFRDVSLELLTPAYFMHRAKAAYQIVAGDIDDALAEVHRATFSFPTKLPYYEFERDLLRGLHEKAIRVAEQRKAARLALMLGPRFRSNGDEEVI